VSAVLPPLRPEYEQALAPLVDTPAERPLPWPRRLWRYAALRKAVILVPAALPAILSGLRIGWAFAWRTLIAAELFFGASSGQGGLGWYIFQNRNELYTDKVFAGLATVILIGLLVESLCFDTLERLTVRRWGMQR